MKTIPLSKGKITLVSDVDYGFLRHWNWWFSGSYAARSEVRNGQKRTIYMHKAITQRMKLRDGQADHRNQNKLDNRRSNLRLATNQQNHANRGLLRHNTSGFKGVCWHKRAKKWMAHITVNNRSLYLKLHNTKRAAARAYNEAALEHFGNYAVLNKV